MIKGTSLFCNDCSSLEFCGEDRTYWRFIFVNGQWKEQSGKLVYEDSELN